MGHRQFFCMIISLIGLCTLGLGQHLSKEQQEYIVQNAVSIEVDEDYQNGNWDPVIEKIKDRKLIFLGEFNHGSKEVFVTRNELIRSLHEQEGISLILFESGIGEVGAVNLSWDNLDKASLTSGFFGGWRAAEFQDLLEYARSDEIPIAGYDVQRTGSTFTKYFSQTMEKGQAFSDLEQQFVNLKRQLSNRGTIYDSIAVETAAMIEQYRSYKGGLSESDSWEARTLDNRIWYLTYMLEFTKTKDWNERWKARDSAMARNISWLLDEFKPEGKVVIIGHNFHISRYNEKEEVMGEFLLEEFDDDMYVMGVFAGEGTYHNNSGRVEILSPPDSTTLDLKHIIKADQAQMTFLGVPDTESEGSQWLFEDIIVNDTFVDLYGSNTMILGRCFDGLLLLDTVSPPIK